MLVLVNECMLTNNLPQIGKTISIADVTRNYLFGTGHVSHHKKGSIDADWDELNTYQILRVQPLRDVTSMVYLLGI
jgi:hypothetical protein